MVQNPLVAFGEQKSRESDLTTRRIAIAERWTQKCVYFSFVVICVRNEKVYSISLSFIYYILYYILSIPFLHSYTKERKIKNKRGKEWLKYWGYEVFAVNVGLRKNQQKSYTKATLSYTKWKAVDFYF